MEDITIVAGSQGNVNISLVINFVTKNYFDASSYIDDIFFAMQVHSTVRQRWLEGDKLIRSTMEEVANIAVEGRKAILEKDYNKLAALMNHNFDLRR